VVRAGKGGGAGVSEARRIADIRCLIEDSKKASWRARVETKKYLEQGMAKKHETVQKKCHGGNGLENNTKKHQQPEKIKRTVTRNVVQTNQNLEGKTGRESRHPIQYQSHKASS